MDRESLYKQTISLLQLIELVVKDKEQNKLIRKHVLDLANNIRRGCD